ncbi:hypothetical protein [Candidatus Poriferisodalis sp.]
MSSAFEKIMDGLREAEAYLEGESAGFRVSEVKVPEPDERDGESTEQ